MPEMGAMTDRDTVVRELLESALTETGTAAEYTSAKRHIKECIQRAYDAGRAAERAAVVAWLLERQQVAGHTVMNVRILAEAIERGAHLKGEKP